MAGRRGASAGFAVSFGVAPREQGSPWWNDLRLVAALSTDSLRFGAVESGWPRYQGVQTLIAGPFTRIFENATTARSGR